MNLYDGDLFKCVTIIIRNAAGYNKEEMISAKRSACHIKRRYIRKGPFANGSERDSAGSMNCKAYDPMLLCSR